MGVAVPDSGVDLGADLYRLWCAGRSNLPILAAQFANANREVVATTADDAAFHRADHFGDSPVLHAFSALRSELQGMLAYTAESLEMTGEALCRAADAYARTDLTAARELDRLRRDNGLIPAGARHDDGQPA